MPDYKKTPIGERLKYWRELRGISQFDLALEGNTSAKHLSFVETGKAHPGRELILRLIETLMIPLAVSNNLLIAAGYAPYYHTTGLSSNELQQTKSVLIDMMINNKQTPSALVDQNWELFAYNDSFNHLCHLFMAQPQLLDTKPLSFLTVLLHPQGLMSSVINKQQFFVAIYSRVRRTMAVARDQKLASQLMTTLADYCPTTIEQLTLDVPQLMVPVEFKNNKHQLHFSLMTASLGSPVNVSFHELQMEFFSAMDQTTKQFLLSETEIN
jgi:transcriptional regulator with XRE-family HTH domain